jgi:hypothetical protein
MDLVIPRQLLRASYPGESTADDHYMFYTHRKTSSTGASIGHGLRASRSTLFLACGERNSSIPLRASTFDSAAMRPRFLNYSKQESRGETKENPTVQCF